MYTRITILLIFMLLSTGCSVQDNSQNEDATNNTSTNSIPTIVPDKGEQSSDTAVPEQIASDILNLLKLKDLPRLAAYVHPIEGVRFSPYGFVNIEKDIIMQANILQDAFENRDIIEWGSYDGSGDPIKLSFTEYYEEFIYDHDYVNVAEISYNEPIGMGNTLNNVSEVYSNSFVAEFHFKGTDKFDFMDWSSLKIVFTQHNDNWVIVGIIHDQWTI